MNNEKLVCIVQEWVLSSLEAENWVDEEPYEMVDFSPAVRNLRYNFTYIIIYMYIYSKIFINCINLHLQSNKHLNLFQFILIVWYFYYFETYVYMNRCF